MWNVWGRHSTEVALALLSQPRRALNPALPRFSFSILLSLWTVMKDRTHLVQSMVPQIQLVRTPSRSNKKACLMKAATFGLRCWNLLFRFFSGDHRRDRLHQRRFSRRLLGNFSSRNECRRQSQARVKTLFFNWEPSLVPDDKLDCFVPVEKNLPWAKTV